MLWHECGSWQLLLSSCLTSTDWLCTHAVEQDCTTRGYGSCQRYKVLCTQKVLQVYYSVEEKKVRRKQSYLGWHKPTVIRCSVINSVAQHLASAYQTVCSHPASSGHSEGHLGLPVLKVDSVFGPYGAPLTLEWRRDAHLICTGNSTWNGEQRRAWAGISSCCQRLDVNNMFQKKTR